MGNRITGSVIIVDSAMGNASILGPSTGNTVNRIYSINAISFWSTGTLGSLVLTQDNTQNMVVRFNFITTAVAGTANNQIFDVTPNPQIITFGKPQQFENLKVPTCTAGTAFIYLS